MRRQLAAGPPDDQLNQADITPTQDRTGHPAYCFQLNPTVAPAPFDPGENIHFCDSLASYQTALRRSNMSTCKQLTGKVGLPLYQAGRASNTATVSTCQVCG
jgi:hypothetical protein